MMLKRGMISELGFPKCIKSIFATSIILLVIPSPQLPNMGETVVHDQQPRVANRSHISVQKPAVLN